MIDVTVKNHTREHELLKEAVVEGMQEKKAHDIAVIDLRNIKNAVADFFVVCTATSDTQADAIADSIEHEVGKELGDKPWHNERGIKKDWILLDYVNVVAHVFLREKRTFYNLEGLWGDADITHIPDL